MYCGKKGYVHLKVGYARVDAVRSRLADAFMQLAKDPDDALVMMDCDHELPVDIVEALASEPHHVGVCGALAFRRGQPYDAQFYFRSSKDGKFYNLVDWEPGLHECTFVGTGAVAIKRWVFDKLIETGRQQPFFRYKYIEGNVTTFPTEDVYFGELCEAAGISHWCDTRIEVPHLTQMRVTRETWEQYKRDNPDKLKYKEVEL
jgi:hypothetical protein